MQAVAEEAVFLTYDEIRILLYSLGYTTCEGIHMPEKQFSAQEVLQAMHRLAGRGLLLIEEEPAKTEEGNTAAPAFSIRPEIRQMMEAMGHPVSSFIFRPGENLPGFPEDLYNGAEYYCYMLPDYCLITEKDWTRRETMRLRAMDIRSFADWRKEREQEAFEESLMNAGNPPAVRGSDASEKTGSGDISAGERSSGEASSGQVSSEPDHTEHDRSKQDETAEAAAKALSPIL